MPTPRTVVVDTNSGASRDYATLVLALAGEAADLVSLDRILTIDLRATAGDAENTGSSTTFTGFTVDATRYPILSTSGSNRLQGVPDTSKYRLICTATVGNTYALNININYAVVDGLQIEIVNGTSYSNTWAVYHGLTGACQPIVANCLILADSSKGGIAGLVTASGQLPVFVNNIVKSTTSPYSGSTGIQNGGINGTGTRGLTYNCTVIGFETGITSYGTQRSEAHNCIAQSNTTDFANLGSTSDYNLSLDTTAPGTHSVISTTLTFTNPSSNIYTLDASDTAAIDVGEDLSTDPVYPVTVDAAGVSRPQNSIFDIGAFEYVAAAGGNLFVKLASEGGLAGQGGLAGISGGLAG